MVYYPEPLPPVMVLEVHHTALQSIPFPQKEERERKTTTIEKLDLQQGPKKRHPEPKFDLYVDFSSGESCSKVDRATSHKARRGTERNFAKQDRRGRARSLARPKEKLSAVADSLRRTVACRPRKVLGSCHLVARPDLKFCLGMRKGRGLLLDSTKISSICYSYSSLPAVTCQLPHPVLTKT